MNQSLRRLRGFFYALIWPIGLFLLLVGEISCRSEQYDFSTELAVVAIGVDISGSLSKAGALPFDVESLRAIAKKAERSGVRLRLGFGAVGGPTSKYFESVELDAVPPIDPKMPLGVRSKLKKARIQKAKSNAAKLEKFVGDCRDRMRTTSARETDITGFFREANVFMSDGIASAAAHRIVFLYSDGKHATLSGSRLDCAALKNSDLFTCGWKNQNRCDAAREVASPVIFADNLQSIFSI